MTKTIINEGDIILVQGTAKEPYQIKKSGGIIFCSCPAWKNLGGNTDNRVCKHIKANIDPACLLPQAQAVLAGTVAVTATSPAQAAVVPPQRLTKTGKISTAHKPPVVKSTAPPCLLAHKWEGEDPTGWWISPKLDGVRAWWDGQKFISRLGNEYHAPEWFKEALPNMILDGELWIGEKRFQETISAVRKLVPTDSEWKNVKFMIFDGGWNSGDNISTSKPFEDRQEYLSYLPFDASNGRFELVEQVKCKGPEHLKEYLREIEAKGGEGVMLRKPGSPYESGRSNTCLKVKTFLDDEAEVIGYTDGKGKHKGRVGALVCKWNGIEFEIGTGLSDEERRNPPAIGSMVTFRYQELTENKIPRFPSFLGVRNYE